MKVKRYNYADQFAGTIDAVVANMRSILVEGDYILSAHVQEFEERFAAYLGVQHVIGVNSGTDALILGLLACGIGPGDEVITLANTFHATVAAIAFAGATPVLVDPNADTFLMTADRLAEAISSKTRAVIPVHLFGKQTPLAEISSLAKEANILVIEDAAQAHGARSRDGTMAGTSGCVGCFSFHPSKNLSAAGDAGAVCTNSAELALRLRMLRALGQQAQNDHILLGMNSKLDSLQAVVLNSKLPSLDRSNTSRRRIAMIYRKELSDLPVCFQHVEAEEKHVYHLFQLGTTRRDALLEHLVESGIDATIRYPIPIHMQPAFAYLGIRPGQFPVAEMLASQLLTLPIRPDMSDDEIYCVVRAVRGFFEKGN